jgi:hypothetical protein
MDVLPKEGKGAKEAGLFLFFRSFRQSQFSASTVSLRWGAGAFCSTPQSRISVDQRRSAVLSGSGLDCL